MANLNATMRRLDTFGAAMRNLNAFGVSANISRHSASLSSYARLSPKLERACPASSPASTISAPIQPLGVPQIQQLTSGLSRGQRGWLAKGMRSWSRAFPTPSQPNSSGLQAYRQQRYLSDLATFLERRHLQSIRKRSAWVRRGPRAIRMRAWFFDLRYLLLSRLSSALTPWTLSKGLLAVLKPPPGWAGAVRFRLGLEAAIPKMLARLASVISPNAPTRLDLLRRRPPGGGPLLSTT